MFTYNDTKSKKDKQICTNYLVVPNQIRPIYIYIKYIKPCINLGNIIKFLSDALILPWDKDKAAYYWQWVISRKRFILWQWQVHVW